MIRYWYCLLLGISLSLFIILSQGKVGNIEVPKSGVVAQTINPLVFLINQARTLTEKGYEQLQQGQAAEALHTWLEATKIYRKLHNHEGVTGSLSNQSLALQELSLNTRACKTLLQALDLEDWVCQSPLGMEQLPLDSGKLLVRDILTKPDQSVRAIALRNLGDVLRLIGKPDESEIVLQQALFMADRLAPNSNTSDTLLSLANTERTLYSRARDRYQTTSEPVSKQTAIKLAQSKFRTALDLYKQVTDSTGEKPNGTALQALLNRLSLSLNVEQSQADVAGWNIPAFKALQFETQPKIQQLLEQLLTARFSKLPAIQSVYARLNFVNSLMQVEHSTQLKQLIFQREIRPLSVALQFAQEAKRVAQQLSNKRALSYAIGTIGNLYTQFGQSSESKQYLEEALSLAQSVQAWDIAYQWQQQLGRLYQQSGNRELAIKAYEGAVNSLDQVRGNILSINPDIQFGFKEKVEPVYREYMRLLLAAPKPNLKQVIQVNERLQLAELENYLQCVKLDLVSLSELKNVNSLPAVVHVINLGEQVEVIVQDSEQSLHRHSANAELVRRNAGNLLVNLQDKRFAYTDEQLIRSYSQELYNLLIAPVKSYLPKAGTLVFVLDSSFQGLPIALLHDGENYLLTQYSISVTLGSQLRQPLALQLGQLRALIAGISKKSPSFNAPNAPRDLAPLPEVENEVADIKENTISTVELLNEKFTSDRFQQKIDTSVFPVIHITTHGQFSSDPEKTVILAWNQAINVRQLNRLLRSNGNQDSIELLVLSACQTALGDERSALGIAGVAVQAGARSTVASLWLVDAKSTAILMGQFYKGLKAGLSKAEALRQAQITLLSNPEYQHPFYWAPFILVGSWL